MKYIFVTGAPGSKWSSIVKNIYYSPSIDRSDFREDRTYYHDASGKLDLMHIGAYWDPGMEFGNFFHNLDKHTTEECEREFNKPFKGTGIRIIKSHVFAHKIDFIKQQWPKCPVVLVNRGDDSCLGWWVKCGHFDITYPTYKKYYRDLKHMADIIRCQNADILTAWQQYTGTEVITNTELAEVLNIQRPPDSYQQNYNASDVKVKVI